MRNILKDYLHINKIYKYKIVPFDKCEIINSQKLHRDFKFNEPKSVILFIAPYFSGYYNNRNVSLYAIPYDYHIYFDNIFNNFPQDNNKFTFKGYADNSPINEVKIAAEAGLGIIGDNGLLINEKYGSFIFIGEIITDYEFDAYDEIKPIRFCGHCGKCRESCPSKDVCLSALTQKKGDLTENEINLIKSNGTAWGCDICQLVCPHNDNIQITEIDFFRENLRPVVDLNCDITNRAYAWRGEKVIHRNVTILNNGGNC